MRKDTHMYYPLFLYRRQWGSFVLINKPKKNIFPYILTIELRTDLQAPEQNEFGRKQLHEDQRKPRIETALNLIY